MIFPVFQPVVDIEEKHVVWRESLARVPNGASVGHQLLLAIAEKNRFIQHIDLAMLSQVFALLHRLDMPTSVNLSYQTVEYGGRQIIEALQDNAFARARLLFEITEVSPIESLDCLMRFRAQLRKLNVALAVDDFGSGFWTEELVTTLEPDIVKVVWMSGAVDRAQIVANSIGAAIVVENVDSLDVLDFLRRKGIRYFQGYLFGKPIAFPVGDCFPSVEYFGQEIPCAK